jgi:hypothetical protein
VDRADNRNLSPLRLLSGLLLIEQDRATKRRTIGTRAINFLDKPFNQRSVGGDLSYTYVTAPTFLIVFCFNLTLSLH